MGKEYNSESISFCHLLCNQDQGNRISFAIEKPLVTWENK